jgi:hypothetical protein
MGRANRGATSELVERADATVFRVVAALGLILWAVAIAVGTSRWPISYKPVFFFLFFVFLPFGAGTVASLPVWIRSSPRRGMRALAAAAAAAGYLLSLLGIACPMWPTAVLAATGGMPPVAILPVGADVVLASVDQGLLAFDTEPGRYRLFPAFRASAKSTLRWAPPSQSLFAVDRAKDAFVVRSMTRFGKESERARVPVTVVPGGDPFPSACTVEHGGTEVACWGVDRSDGRLHVSFHAIGDSARPPAEAAVATPGVPERLVFDDDAANVFFTTPCPHNEVCLHTAPRSGGATVEIARFHAPVCALAVSSDGLEVAVGTGSEKDFSPDCYDVWVTGITPSSPRHVARFTTTDPSSHGIKALAWAPQRQTLAALADVDAGGCAGVEGITVCHEQLYVIDVASGVRRLVSALTMDAFGEVGLTWAT